MASGRSHLSIKEVMAALAEENDPEIDSNYSSGLDEPTDD